MDMEDKVKTRTVSFRIPENILQDIEKDAKTRLSSTNSLINQILLQYTKWDKYEHGMKMFRIPEDGLQYVLANLDEIKRGEAADIIFNSIRDWTLISKKKFDIHTCLETLEDYCRMANIGVEDVISKEGTHSFIIRHNLGRNVSLLVKEIVEKIFWDLVKIRIDSQLTDTTVIAKLCSKFE